MTAMKPVHIDHPSIQEMIFRRSLGDVEYVAGIRTYLEHAKEPAPGTKAHSGYIDAHDMSAHLSEVFADLVADEFEDEARLHGERTLRSEESAANRRRVGCNLPSLSRGVAEKKVQPESTLQRNTEFEAKLDRFIGENPDLRVYFEKLSKDELIRKLMVGRMRRSEYSNGRNAAIRAWVEEHAEIKGPIEGIRDVPQRNRERAIINPAKSEAINPTAGRVGNRIRP